MKKTELVENIILLVSAILLLPIWLFHSEGTAPPGMLSAGVYQLVQTSVLVVLGVILVRRVRRIVAALREGKNRQGPFPF